MGANQSHNPENEISRLKLEEQNKLLREKIKNQELSNKLQVLQNLLEKQRIDSVIRGKSPNPLLNKSPITEGFSTESGYAETVFWNPYKKIKI